MILRFVSLIFKRTYPVLFLSFFSLLIGGFLFGVVLSFTKSGSAYLIKEGKVLAGGDIIFRSPYPISTSTPIFVKQVENGHIFAEGKTFQAVFTANASPNGKGKTAPATVRVVGDLFPLYGEVIIKDGKPFTQTRGGVYVESVFLERLGITVGDTVSIGTSTFTILGVLEKEPDAISLGISFTPKVIIFESDFRDMTLDLSQSRVEYKLYLKEGEKEELTEETIQELEQYAKDSKLRFDNATDGPNNLIRGLSSVDDFIGIVLSIALFLVVINILANLVYVLSKFRKTIALLKVYGATAFQIEVIYSVLLSSIGGVAGGVGAYVGWYTVLLGSAKLAAYTGITIEIISSIYVLFFGFLFGAVFVGVAAIPFLLALKKIQPKELLLNQSSNTKSTWKERILKEGPYYLPIPLTLTALLYVVSGDIYLSIISVALCSGLFVVFMGVSYLVIVVLHKSKERFSFIIKSILSFLYLRNFETIITTASIMTAFCGVFIVAAVESNITTNLVRNVSTTAPSLYLIDITKTQLKDVTSIAGQTFKEYPIVRGRLLLVNQKAVESLDNPSLRREFNMTYRDTLIDGENVTEGTFNQTVPAGTPVVSIDKEFGDELGGVKLGDTVSVFIQGITLTATITSIREVDSTSGIPFFYLVFPTSVLSNFPASYFVTVDVEDDDRKEIENAIGARFPNIIPIDTSAVIGTITSLLATIVTLVSLVGLPSIILGVVLVLVMLYQSLYERSGDVLILRAFGFTKKDITKLFIIESAVLSLVCGILAYGVAHAVAFVLNIYLFSFKIFSFATLPLYIILGNIIVVIVFSYILSGRLTTVPLKKLLAEK